jgi:hypothetical protein
MLTYNNVSPDAWQAIKGAVAANFAADISADIGSSSTQGFTIQWQYTADARVLNIQCTDSPFFAPCSMINGKINDAVEACMQSHGLAPDSLFS